MQMVLMKIVFMRKVLKFICVYDEDGHVYDSEKKTFYVDIANGYIIIKLILIIMTLIMKTQLIIGYFYDDDPDSYDMADDYYSQR